EVILLRGLNALRHDAQAQFLAHSDDGAHHAVVLTAPRDVHHKAAIDLEGTGRKVAQVAQIGVARSKIVDRDPDPHGPQAGQRLLTLLRFIKKSAFHNFNAERASW